MLALVATVRGDATTAFWWMAYTLFVDSIDGTLARAVGVKQVVPFVDGSKLDDIVDYFTYVIVPALFVIWMGLVPGAVAFPVTALVVIASGYGFAQAAAKTADHFFTGFPSYWNVVVFYLYVLGWPLWLNAAVLTILAIAVFVPLRYVYPSRTPTLRWLTITLACLWGAAILWTFVHLNDPPRAVVLGSLLFPIYYVGLSLYLHFAKAPRQSG
ncbi:MAG TPA: CDP-diacylglycerol O-phosphatidyltransferase [Candidatus Binatia bacterium]|jgi:phosphatidylcholine synthase|nr:CDP-diacylglycerol O-phosphatidyltransferase [Candidatus Binatia bacterium]